MDSYVTMIKAMLYTHFITLTFGGAVIGNDKIILGIDDFGALSTPYEAVLGLPATDPTKQGVIGIRSRENGMEGGWVEGWGVAIPEYNIYGGTEYGIFKPSHNLIALPFTGTSGGDNAVAHVRDTTGSFEVVHDFFPDPISQFAMKIEVTITNTSPNNWNSVVYRRAMHTDTITTDGQHVDTILTMQGTATPSVVATSTNPWQGTNPLTHDPLFDPGLGKDTLCDINVFNQDFNGVGPCYFGFAADFEVGPLNNGESVTFGLWYGGAATAEQVQADLSSLCGGGPQFYVFAEREGFTYTFFMAYVESIQLTTCPECEKDEDCPDGEICCNGPNRICHLPIKANSIMSKSFLHDEKMNANLVSPSYNNKHMYGYILLIGIIAFILINNAFIGCCCLHRKQDIVSYGKCDEVTVDVNNE